MAEIHIIIAEKAEIIWLVGKNVISFREVAREFNRKHQQKSVNFKTVINNTFNDIGSVFKVKPQPVNNVRIFPQFDEIVLQLVHGNFYLALGK